MNRDEMQKLAVHIVDCDTENSKMVVRKVKEAQNEALVHLTEAVTASDQMAVAVIQKKLDALSDVLAAKNKKAVEAALNELLIHTTEANSTIAKNAVGAIATRMQGIVDSAIQQINAHTDEAVNNGVRRILAAMGDNAGMVITFMVAILLGIVTKVVTPDRLAALEETVPIYSDNGTVLSTATQYVFADGQVTLLSWLIAGSVFAVALALGWGITTIVNYIRNRH